MATLRMYKASAKKRPSKKKGKTMKLYGNPKAKNPRITG